MAASGPDRVKTRSEFGSIGAAVCQCGLELAKCLGEAEDRGKKGPSQARMASISARLPSIFITRFRL